MPDAEHFGGRILQARLDLAAARRRPVSQAEVGRALGVTGVTVGRWESGAKEPSLGTFVRLAAILRAAPGFLAFGPRAMEVPANAAGGAAEAAPPAHPPTLPAPLDAFQLAPDPRQSVKRRKGAG